MSAYEELLRAAFSRIPDPGRYLTSATLAAYDEFRRAKNPELSFRFERVRLGVAMSLLQLLADLGDHDESRQVLAVLHRALGARSTSEIDAIIQKEVKHFERLYTNLYVNEEGEQLLHLFERTLDADSQPLMEEVIQEALALTQELDFTQDEEDDED
ncbi:hypothetical protein J0X19_12330 [Hymenobacter sp. BT186]|uniref:Uncharacterized protein n=1 Tax=Hymenobacter telluris TaxID=2816474 RepID=A0A939JDV4_9BACT|nr:hypothetical protein [Hymenobacter telluris]MBO0358737.1 hypothetical protein [Hymenobacter telluris]MBW3374763.1 hypothetical protein [Hymenobacter norwichensis]